MTHYRLLEKTQTIEGKELRTYGVSAFDSSGKLICEVSDITAVKEKAEYLAKLCEKMKLSPIHLFDVAEDYIISDKY